MHIFIISTVKYSAPFSSNDAQSIPKAASREFKLQQVFFQFFSSGLKSDEGGDEMNESHEGFCQFVGASGNAPKFFDSAKEPLTISFLTQSARVFSWTPRIPHVSSKVIFILVCL